MWVLNLRQKSLRFQQFSVFFHMTTMKAFLMFHFLIWTSVWIILQFLDF